MMIKKYEEVTIKNEKGSTNKKEKLKKAARLYEAQRKRKKPTPRWGVGFTIFS